MFLSCKHKARAARPKVYVLLPAHVGRAASALTAHTKIKITHLHLYSVYLQLPKYRVDCPFLQPNK